MTAVREVTAETRTERLERQKYNWQVAAAHHLIALGVYTEDEFKGAMDLADSLYEVDSDGLPCHTPTEAVDEELTYWGD